MLLGGLGVIMFITVTEVNTVWHLEQMLEGCDQSIVVYIGVRCSPAGVRGHADHEGDGVASGEASL